jgi:uncharacterized protein (TIGR00162 family)
MEETVIKINKKVKLNKPILIVGLPGIGSVGKLVVGHLIKEFGAKRFATLYSPHFPHQVVMRKDGGIRLVSNRFYVMKAQKPGGSDMVLLTGDVQAVTPEGQYEVNSRITDFFTNELRGRFVYTIGGYSIGEGVVSKPRVFGNTTRTAVISQFKDYNILFGKSKGLIWGSAGLILAFAKMSEVDGICLMGETSFLEVDASAAKAVLTILAKKLDLKVDMTSIDEKITKAAATLHAFEQQVATGFGGAPGSEAGDNSRPTYIR